MSFPSTKRIRALCEEALVAIVCFYALLFALIESYFAKRRLSRKVRALSPTQTPQRAQEIQESPGSTESRQGKISILIATRNESRSIGKTLRTLESNTIDKLRVEIIIIDVGSTDNTIDVAKASTGAIPVTFIRKQDGAHLGRGSALNEAYSKASGDIILILRADLLVPRAYDETLRRELNNPRVLLTSFKFAVDRNVTAGKPVPPGLWILELYYYLRSSLLWFPSTMQGLALTKESFGSRKFSESIVMDDVDFCLRCRNDCITGNLEFSLLDEHIECSSDRWEATGVFLWIFMDSLANVLFMNIGLSPRCVYFICYDILPSLLWRRSKPTQPRR
jgi:glycosyltransferase involved in cell wall biosynthesis